MLPPFLRKYDRLDSLPHFCWVCPLFIVSLFLCVYLFKAHRQTSAEQLAQSCRVFGVRGGGKSLTLLPITLLARAVHKSETPMNERTSLEPLPSLYISRDC